MPVGSHVQLCRLSPPHYPDVTSLALTPWSASGSPILLARQPHRERLSVGESSVHVPQVAGGPPLKIAPLHVKSYVIEPPQRPEIDGLVAGLSVSLPAASATDVTTVPLVLTTWFALLIEPAL